MFELFISGGHAILSFALAAVGWLLALVVVIGGGLFVFSEIKDASRQPNVEPSPVRTDDAIQQKAPIPWIYEPWTIFLAIVLVYLAVVGIMNAIEMRESLLQRSTPVESPSGPGTRP